MAQDRVTPCDVQVEGPLRKPCPGLGNYPDERYKNTHGGCKNICPNNDPVLLKQHEVVNLRVRQVYSKYSITAFSYLKTN